MQVCPMLQKSVSVLFLSIQLRAPSEVQSFVLRFSPLFGGPT